MILITEISSCIRLIIRTMALNWWQLVVSLWSGYMTKWKEKKCWSWGSRMHHIIAILTGFTVLSSIKILNISILCILEDGIKHLSLGISEIASLSKAFSDHTSVETALPTAVWTSWLLHGARTTNSNNGNRVKLSSTKP